MIEDEVAPGDMIAILGKPYIVLNIDSLTVDNLYDYSLQWAKLTIMSNDFRQEDVRVSLQSTGDIIVCAEGLSIASRLIVMSRMSETRD